MEISFKIDIQEFCILLIILAIGIAYLWIVLPRMETWLRLLIMVIAPILILILGISFKNQDFDDLI